MQQEKDKDTFLQVVYLLSSIVSRISRMQLAKEK